MISVRGFRPLALVLVVVLALAGVVLGLAQRAVAAPLGHVVGVVEDLDNPGTAIPNRPVHLMRITMLSFENVAQTTTLADGSFDFAVADDGDYLVFVDGGTSWTDGVGFAGGYDHTDGLTGDVNPTPIYLEAAYSISGIVLGAGSPISDALVEAYDSAGLLVGSNQSFSHLYGTEPDGTYTIKVPVDPESYTLIANGGPGWHEQAYNLIDDPPCGCTPVGDPVAVNGAPVAGVDFNLTPHDLAFDLYVERETAPGSGSFAAIDGLDVIIEQLVGATWTEVYRETTDASGQVYFSDALSGDFRVRFDLGALPVRYMDSVRFPRSTYDPVGGCFASYPGVGPGTYIAVDYGFSFTDVSCASSPPVAPASGPRPARPRASFPTFGVALPTPSATPIPSATPTSSPTPSSSPSESPSASPEPTVDPQSTQNAFDLWWLWLLLLLIVAAIIFFIVRAVARR